jgi:hypothetical protein
VIGEQAVTLRRLEDVDLGRPAVVGGPEQEDRAGADQLLAGAGMDLDPAIGEVEAARALVDPGDGADMPDAVPAVLEAEAQQATADRDLVGFPVERAVPIKTTIVHVRPVLAVQRCPVETVKEDLPPAHTTSPVFSKAFRG